MQISMQYVKPHLSFENQAELLIQRGLIVGDKQWLIQILKQVSYYRLSAYWYPFREKDEQGVKKDNLYAGTTLERVWDHYRFDRRLRVLFVDAIERIEIALRTQLVYLYTEKHSPFEYAAPSSFPNWSFCEDKIRKIEEQAGIKNGSCTEKCRYECIKHFFRKYGDSHQHLPLWMFSEISDFGFTSLFFDHAGRDIQTEIAKEWEVTPEVLRSWMRSLNTLRNTCAHHGRLWNNLWGTPPKLPLWHSQRGWYAQYSLEKGQWILPRDKKNIQPSFAQDRTAMLLFICRYLLKKIIPCTEWPKRMEKLFSDFSDKGIDFSNMGFSNPEWQKHPIWKTPVTPL